ncbi:MAG: biopolymer transporter ExbD [Blastocatellia bacterium]|nr:biopolymer transporter ExbD [Blastocatellia bacterium]MCS7158417.1 biopolymer transporter ExbD [Blastocatellia bacterium]MCX7752923.1 biopolymer transporter ExbD [Blastocatellia bacterium]MDW8167979.1 biopolymer transporter ExbD [Acidobacteriota bacterium]MDW8256354.1 biopolymer transporter ExbD [Acidobacteriota bacterium]
MLQLRKRIHRIAPTVPTASMADIAFLLIIFFLVTTVFTTDQTVVDLPTSVNREDVYRNSALITITVDRVIKVTDGEHSETVQSIEQLDRFIADVLRRTPDRPFVVKADRAVPYQLVEFALERLRLSRARTVYFLTEGRPPRRPS